MLSSSTSRITNNETPFQIPSSFFDNQDGFLVHQDLTTQDYFFPNVAIGNVDDIPLLDNFSQDIILKHGHDNNVALDGNPRICDPLLINLLHPRWKKPDAVINKHRHRKVVTGQGSRERRVRLSIQIARRFFNLQDNLGFDKASQTIDWLLTQSKSAIEEIAKIKERRCSTNIAANELEKDIEAAEVGDSFKINSSISSSSTSGIAKEIGISMQQQHSSDLAKELRAKARERARERTKARMSVKKLIELQKLGSDFEPIIPNSWNQVSSYKTPPYLSSSREMRDSIAELGSDFEPIIPNSWNQVSSYKTPPYLSSSREMRDSIAESILITKKLNALQNFTTNQQNFTTSRQLPSSSTTINTENWEISNIFSQESPSTTGYGRCYQE